MPGLPPLAPAPASVWIGATGRTARRAAWIGTAVAALVFLLLATRGQPWELFAHGPFTSDFYDVQARALSRGHLDVPRGAAGIEGYEVNGRTYFYYGLVPAVARLPISAITTVAYGRLVVLSQLLALVVTCMASARLLQRARDALKVAVPTRPWPAIIGGFAAAAGLASPLLWLSSRALVYHEAELWGAALAILGFERIVAWWSSRQSLDLVLASGSAALALSTRGSSGAGPALALGILAVVLAARGSWQRALWAGIATAVPFLAYAIVNEARFGTPFSIPFAHQALNSFSAQRRAALADNGGTLFGLKFLPTAALQYFRPDTIGPRSLLPWFSWTGKAQLIGHVTFDTIDRSASLPVTAPLFLVTGIPGVLAVFRRRPPTSWAASLLAAGVAAVPTLTIAFIAQRYLADFVPLLVVAAALGVPVVASWASRSAARRWAAVTVGVALALGGLMVNAGLAVLARHLYLVPASNEERAFVALQYKIHDRLGGRRPPSVTRADSLGQVGPDGAIVILGDCDGLYRSDGEHWRELELRPGGKQRLVLEGATDGTLVSGAGWRIDLESVSGGRRLRYVGPTTIYGRTIPTVGAMRIDVVADPAVPTVRARVGDELVLEAFLQRADGPLVASPTWRSVPGDASLCDNLRARLG